MTTNNKKIKVLFILRCIGFGGAERQVVEICKGLNKDKFDVKVVLFFHDEGYLEELKNAGAKIDILSDKKNYKFEIFPKLYRYLKENEFDIIQTFLPIPNLVGGFMAKFFSSAKIVGSLRNVNPFRWDDIFCVMDYFALNLFSDYVVSNSNSGKKLLEDQYNVPEKKIFVIKNGINLERFADLKDDKDFKVKLGISPDTRIITSIGRIAEQKGHKYLAEAANMLINQYKKDLIFLLIGKDEEAADEVKSLIQKYSLNNHFKLFGIREDIESILGITDIFILPSLWEGQSNVLLEAMVTRLPIIATDIPENKEVLEDGKTGILIPPEKPEAIVDNILKILDNLSRFKKMGEAAKEVILKEYSLEVLSKNYEKLYEKLSSK